MPYGLIAGHDNTPILLTEIVSGEPLESHATSLGTFRAARELVALDGITYDDGTDTWEWTFAALLPSDIEAIETDVLNGARSGPVTVETRNRYGAFVVRNAILTLPATLSLRGVKFETVVFAFTQGRPTS